MAFRRGSSSLSRFPSAPIIFTLKTEKFRLVHPYDTTRTYESLVTAGVTYVYLSVCVRVCAVYGCESLVLLNGCFPGKFPLESELKTRSAALYIHRKPG